MTLGSAVANFGLSAIATPTSTNVANDVRIGVAPASVGFPTADVAYSFKVSSTAGFDVATLTYETGSVAQTTGTPTILDGDGKDFEGVAISMVELYAVLFEASGNAHWTIAHNDTLLPDMLISTGTTMLWAKPSAIDVDAPTTMAMTSSSPASSDVLQVTVIGKSS